MNMAKVAEAPSCLQTCMQAQLAMKLTDKRASFDIYWQSHMGVATSLNRVAMWSGSMAEQLVMMTSAGLPSVKRCTISLDIFRC